MKTKAEKKKTFQNLCKYYYKEYVATFEIIWNIFLKFVSISAENKIKFHNKTAWK